jgi:hypothetical protein
MIGTKIKVALIELNLTQNWLWEKLKTQGFPKLPRAYFGKMLMGQVDTQYAEIVLKKCVEIIESQKENK